MGKTESLELKLKKAEYFKLLVLYGKAKSDHEIKHYFEKLLTFIGIDGQRVQVDQYEFYQKWYYTAIRELIHIIKFRDNYSALGRMLNPPITPTQTRKAVALLERLGFIKRNRQQVYELTDVFISAGENWKSAAVRTFQAETMKLALRALEEIPKDERDISTVTITLNKDGLEQARERIRQLHKDLFAIADACENMDDIYQVNMQMFPLSCTKKATGTV